jgi:hypothetical protein
MKCKAPAFFIIICSFNMPCFAQTTTDTSHKKNNAADSSYIRSYDNYVNITAGWNTRNTEYHISYPAFNTRFVLSPKETDQFSLNLDYSFLFVYYSFTPHVFNLNNNDSIKGSSKRSTFATGFSFKQWNISFDYQNIKGYYLKNTGDFIPGWSKGDVYLQFPYLKTIQTGGQVSYNFNKRFSVSSLVSGKEQQLKTAFTLWPMLAYWNIKMKDEANDSAQKTDNALTINNDINLLLPLAANIVFAKNFYIAAFAGPAIGINFYSAKGYDANAKAISTSGTTLSNGYYVRGSIGYTGKKFYMGFDAFARKYWHGAEEHTFAKYSYGLQAYAGTRFDPPRILRKTFAWLDKLIPL